ncbi:MAG: DUF5674 family protein [Patescibacteria group bacterium]
MLLVLTTPADPETKKKVSEDLAGYVKVVVDVSRGILAAGGLRHVEGEQTLLSQGSKQEDLWGGGIDMETGEIDFDSMINIRPSQDNPSREVLDINIRARVEQIIRKLLP